MKIIAVLIVACFAVAQGAEIKYQLPVHPKDLPFFGERIISGRPAVNGQFPHQVGLLGNVGGGNIICGGSLISPDWVLTAAHCVAGVISFEIRMGSVNFNQPQLTLRSTNFFAHENYNSNNLNNDVALIRLPQSVVFNNNIRSIALPREGETSETFLGAIATVSGFGRTSNNGAVSNTLNHVNIRIIGNPQCAQVYGSGTIVAGTVCGVGADFNQQSTCSGDSGGPLILNRGGSMQQIGVVSFVSGAGCDSGNPSGYVRTTHFRSWIRQRTGV